MAEPELLLDSDIRLWVFLSIILLTFLVGILRHYVSMLLSNPKKIESNQVQDSQAMLRSRALRENGKYLPKQAFLMRKYYFNNEETGYFKTTKRPTPPQPMTDPSMMTDSLKSQATNVLPMILIGTWISNTFSGFITSKVPFGLTLRFKPMLQKGIDLVSLDASWVSSVSWYYLNVIGLRSIYALFLGENNAADEAKLMEDQMSGVAMAMPQDPQAAFQNEWEALEICEHRWVLKDVENEILEMALAEIQE